MIVAAMMMKAAAAIAGLMFSRMLENICRASVRLVGAGDEERDHDLVERGGEGKHGTGQHARHGERQASRAGRP